MLWQLLQSQIPNNHDQLIDFLLENRGISQKETFLKPLDPIKLSASDVGISEVNLKKALTRIHRAIKNQEKVIIFGDYDVDGISATAILWESIKVVGLTTQPFIPNRLTHGYGLSVKALKAIFESETDKKNLKPDLIITVDNGIVAHEALDFLKNLDIDVIVTDHHQPDDDILPVLTTIHTTQLAGAGVAWFIAKALVPDRANEWLDLVTIATIADQMPLLGANRAIVTNGLDILNTQVNRAGLKALFQVAGMEPKNLTADQLSFSLIPRLNAMGRVADGIESLRLLCVKSIARANTLAATLQLTNLARRELTDDLMKEALIQAENQQAQKLIVVVSKNFHEGVIGLLAGKIMEKFHKPVVAIQVSEKIAKASVRSMPGIDIIEFLRKNQELFLELGGHKLAAGFVCDPARILTVTTQLISSAEETLTDDQLNIKQLVDCQLSGKFLNLQAFAEIAKLEPFGQANSKPVFLIQSAKVTQISIIGKNKQHLRLKLNFDGHQELVSLAWHRIGWLEHISINQKYNFLIQLELNLWQDQRQLQLILIDWQPTV